MRYSITLILLLILPIASAGVLDCQYKVSEEFKGEVTKLYRMDTGEYVGDGLVINGFKGGLVYSEDTACITSFNITNPNNFEVKVVFDFELVRGIVAEDTKKVLFMSSHSTRKLEYRVYNYSACSINPDSLTYYLMEPYLMTPEVNKVTEMRNKCKNCGGEICLDDNAKCEKDKDCGSGLCSDGVCIPCPDCDCEKNEVKCNDKCVKVGHVKSGRKPVCSPDECISGKVDPLTFKCMDEEQGELTAMVIAPSSEKKGHVGFIITGFLAVIIISLFIVGKKDPYGAMSMAELQDKGDGLKNHITAQQELLIKMQERIEFYNSMSFFDETDKIGDLKREIEEKGGLLKSLRGSYNSVQRELHRRNKG